jgi:dephospho-CoA kinase
MIIGITGGTGSGKTTLLETARGLGFQVLDCDAIYHRLLETDQALLDAIEHRFPGVVENGQLQRKKLGTVVFADKTALDDLNRITHAAITHEVKKQLITGVHTAIDAIALFESGMDQLCDLTVAVSAPVELRVKRLMERDGISEAYARSRIASQKEDDWYRQRCGYFLVNDGTAEGFQGKCLAFFQQLGIMKETTNGGAI